MPEETAKQSVLLLLSKYSTSSCLCPMRKSEMYAEDGRLRYKTRWCFHHGHGHGGKCSPIKPPP